METDDPRTGGGRSGAVEVFGEPAAAQQPQQREQHHHHQQQQQQQQQQRSGEVGNIGTTSVPRPIDSYRSINDGSSRPSVPDPSITVPDVSTNGSAAGSRTFVVRGNGPSLPGSEQRESAVRSPEFVGCATSTGYSTPVRTDIVGTQSAAKSRVESFDSTLISDRAETAVPTSLAFGSALRASTVIDGGSCCSESLDTTLCHGTSPVGMTTCVQPPPSPFHTRYVLRRLSCSTPTVKTDFRYTDRDPCGNRIHSGTRVMLSPTATELSLIDPDSRTSSRTSTPTMVRTRPRLPTGLTRHKDLLTVTMNSGTVSPPLMTRGLAAEDIACDFNSLGRTDFVRKYSTKVRSGSETLPRSGLPGQGLSSCAVLPESTQNALLMMSGGDVERDRNVRPHTLGGLTPTRTRSIKLKLEKLRDTRRSSEATVLVRKDSGESSSSSPESSRKDSNSSCDAEGKNGARVPSESTGPMDTYCKTSDNNVPRGQLHRLNIAHSQPPLGKERRYYTLPARRSASPAGQSTDADMRESPSKTVAADRRLLHQNAVESLSLDVKAHHTNNSGEHGKDLSDQMPSSGKEWPVKSVRPAAVRWEIGRDSLDSDRSTPPPKDRTNQQQDEASRKISDVAEDEGVGEIDLDPDESYNLSSLPRSTNKELWLTMKSPETNRVTGVPNDQDSVTANRGVKFKEADRGESVVCGPGKLPNGRFYTHPPSKERTSVQEAGSVDTNGFGALRDSRPPERPSSEELKLQLSTVSIDSQSCIGDQSYSTYHDVLRDVTAEGTSIDSHLERKNSKTLKQKSKSDPCGEKQKESMRMTQTLEAPVQSTPLLIEEKPTSSSNHDGAPPTVASSADKRTSHSDSSLLKTEKSAIIQQPVGVLSDPGTKSRTSQQETSYIISVHRSSSRKRDNRSSDDAEKPKTTDSQDSADSVTVENDSLPEMAPILVESDGEPLSPDSQSPDSTLGRERTLGPASQSGGSVMASLTLPFSKAKNTALTRSHSSASVFLSKSEVYRNTTPSPGSTRQKELVKRRPHFSEHHLGQPATGSIDLSGHKRDKNWASGYCPSLEPIYAQSSLSLFEGAAEEKATSFCGPPSTCLVEALPLNTESRVPAMVADWMTGVLGNSFLTDTS
ncbi:hypothetical protein LSH36_12g28019 [Paralvinella palmiformis]|uniref:Uncharacterized protein n=1 Tax=Paralvinella palmiformis TaxID=53620 RepID=A0AAD9KEC1_9ANNE|nr:hypothetical protein LSH36_12g28019 [Paralvinella palmiformis]